jgi:hypothetical protein
VNEQKIKMIPENAYIEADGVCDKNLTKISCCR